MITDVTVYLVGGAVRDEILGVKNKDIDFSVEALSYDDMRAFILEHGKIFLETPEYFTIRAHIYDMNGWSGDADFVLCRRDSKYADGRRPDKVFVSDIHDDLKRRDFTMNAIARMVYPVSGEYYDPFGGIKDLQNGLIRCVGNPEDRFQEDALRMLRALRFSITKEMRIDSSITRLLKKSKYVDLLSYNISEDRKRDELYKMFKYDTMGSLMLLSEYPLIMESLFDFEEGNIWLKPTNEQR